MNGLPIKEIDRHILPLVLVLNRTNVVKTLGSCEGHGLQRTASIIFDVVDIENWKILLLKLLQLNNKLKEANINIVQRHYLNTRNEYFIDWELIIEVHPRNKEIEEPEDYRIFRVKTEVFKKVTDAIKNWIESNNSLP